MVKVRKVAPGQGANTHCIITYMCMPRMLSATSIGRLCAKITDGQTYRRTDVQTYRRTDVQTYRRTDVQTDRQTERQTDRHTDRETDRHTDRQTDIQ